MLSRMLSIFVGGNLLADLVFDEVAEARRLLDAQAGCAADVEDELAAVSGWGRNPDRATGAG